MNWSIKRLTSLFLVMLMFISALTPFCSVSAAEEVISDGKNPDLEFTVVNIKPSVATGGVPALVTAPIKMLASRAWQELASYSITNDVPGLSTFFKLLMTPAQRSAAAQKQMVTQMVTDIAEIKAGVNRIETQLHDVADKIDKYETASAFSIAANQFKSIATKYTAPWAAYEAMVKTTESLEEPQKKLDEAKAQLEKITEAKGKLETGKTSIEGELATATDETKKAEIQAELDKVNADIATADANIALADETIASLEKTIEDINKLIDEAMLRFIAVCEEGGGISFATDLSAITSAMWNTDNPTGSYLGAYEAFLRERYAFEHEITDSLKAAYETCVDTMIQMLTIYTEYYTYKQTQEPDNALYKSYSVQYFDAVQKKIISNFDIIARASGFDKLMITEDYSEEELAEFRTNDPDFMPPENISQEVVIGGVTYKCYKVRDNKDLHYYIILKQNVSNKTLISKTSPDYATWSGDVMMDYYGNHVYRPTAVLENHYTDDGRYEMIGPSALPDFITASSSILASLRSGSGLTEIPQDAAYLMLYYDECITGKDYLVSTDIYWNTKLYELAGSGDVRDIKTVSSKSIYNDNKYSSTILIYRQINTDEHYGSDGVWKVLDKGEISGQTITVNDGQTLDLSAITVNINNVNIHIIGKGTVISNPDITLTDSHLVISSEKAVYIENLNMKGRNYQKAVVEIVKKNNEYISFNGKNTFTATSKQLTGLDVYKYYVEGLPIAASCGMYISEGSDCVIYCDDAVFRGSAGGSGICSDADVTFRGTGTSRQLTAEGSTLDNIESLLDGAPPKAIGAGIGVCFSGVEKLGGPVRQGGINLDRSHGYLGTKGTYSFNSIKVNASGVDGKSDGEFYSDDIGSVYTQSGDFRIAGGNIVQSSVTTKRASFAPEINLKSQSNAFFPDKYTITAYTKGSNGVTKDGVEFNIIGVSAESGWVYASQIGNDKGQSRQTVTVNSAGTIKEIKVRTKASNIWYPGKITVTSEFTGQTITVYGGRWIGTKEKTLSPDDNIYELTVKTGTADNSGTDANIYVYLKDKEGLVTDNVEVSDIHQDSNAFEKGDTDTFPIYAPDDFGECTNIFLESDHSNAAAGWLVDSLTVKKVQGSTKDSGFTVDANFWYEYAKTVNFGKYSGDTGAYYLEVKTGNKTGSGTNSAIYLKLNGGNTSEKINMSDMAGSGDDFEKNDLDCFRVGFTADDIGNLSSIEISKNNKGSGPDWYLKYIRITEIVAEGQKAKTYTFNAERWIENKSYTLSVSSQDLIEHSSLIDREILEGLSLNENGSYTLTVNRNVKLTEEVLGLLQETGKTLTVVMTNEDKPIYSLTFDGNKIEDYYSLNLDKSYSFADGNAMLDFLGGAKLPAGTTVKLYTENIGFIDSDDLVIFSKDEGGKWNEEISLVSADGIIEVSLEEGKELLINKAGSDLPSEETEEDVNDNPPTGDNVSIYACALVFLSAVLILLFERKKRQAER